MSNNGEKGLLMNKHLRYRRNNGAVYYRLLFTGNRGQDKLDRLRGIHERPSAVYGIDFLRLIFFAVVYAAYVLGVISNFNGFSIYATLMPYAILITITPMPFKPAVIVQAP